MAQAITKAAEFTIAAAGDSYARHLKAANRAERTRLGYLEAVTQLDAHLPERGMPRDVTAIRREHVESWVVARPTGEDPLWHAPRAVHDRSRYRRTLRLAWPSRRSKRSVASTPAT